METLKRWFQIGLSDDKKKGTRLLSSEVNLKKLMAYGGPLEPGTVQLSFSFPVEASEQAREAARVYVEKMGFSDPHVVLMESMGINFSHFIVFARSKQSVDFTKMKAASLGHAKKTPAELSELVRQKLSRRLTVLAVDFSDSASSEKIDRIMSIKGYRNEYGLERYSCFKVVNLHAQNSLELLRRKLVEFKPDAVLVGQATSLKTSQTSVFKELNALFQSQKNSEIPLKILIGPVWTTAALKKIGFDACFGEEHGPAEIAAFIVQGILERVKK